MVPNPDLTQPMLQYYEQRQPEYEAIYAKPERQADLLWLEGQLTNQVRGKRVFEIACGTGYWTRRMALVAQTVHATDASHQLVSTAVSSCTTGKVTSATVDAFDVPRSHGFDCVVAGFFFSHVRVDQRRGFVDGLAKAFEPGTRIVLFDNQYVQGSSTAITRRNGNGDTYQTRKLSDGSKHEVLKNFPTAAELALVLSESCETVEVLEAKYFWLATGLVGY